MPERKNKPVGQFLDEKLSHRLFVCGEAHQIHETVVHFVDQWRECLCDYVLAVLNVSSPFLRSPGGLAQDRFGRYSAMH